MKVCLASLRHGLHWPTEASCIQDAFFALTKRWLSECEITPSFYGISWNAERPTRDEQALAAAEWIFVYSSNEWTYYGSDVVNPLFAKGSNERIDRIKRHFKNKRVVLFSIDMHDTEELLRNTTLYGVDPAEFHFISEAEFPTTVHSVRYGQISRLGLRDVSKERDLSYWGTTKRRVPGGAPSGDARYDIMRALLVDPALDSYLAGNHFGKRKADDKFLAASWEKLARARATICFHWPGNGKRLTGRYHEALAMGMIPFVHVGYDSHRQLAKAQWQHIASAAEARIRILGLRDPAEFRERYEEVLRSYEGSAPSDEAQYRRFAKRLDGLKIGKGEKVGTMEAWQQGFELDRLRQFAAPFKERHKPLVFGAFGLTKERDVAEALAKNQALWTGNPPQAIALFKPVKLGSEQTDFAGRTFEIPPGSIVVKAFVAASEAAGGKVLRALLERAKAPVWIEIFEEDAVSRSAVKAAGFDYVTTKVSAGSELKGIYVRGAVVPLNVLEGAELATLSVIKPNFLSAKQHAAIKAEVTQFESQFAQHYSDYNKRKSWTAFALHGYSDDPTFIIKPAEMSKSWKEENAALMASKVRWTKAAKNFPATVEAVNSLGLALDRVRFMRLRAKDGELSRHADITDREAGVQDGRVTRLHVPIVTSEAVTMIGWSARGERGEVKFPERALCYLDQRKPHSVFNKDPALNRVHLVVDCFANGKVRKMIAAAVTKAAQGLLMSERTAKRPFAA